MTPSIIVNTGHPCMIFLQQLLIIPYLFPVGIHANRYPFRYFPWLLPSAEDVTKFVIRNSSW
ncbi:hypothetical protein BDV28DRAFT_138332 [Aspergillus coremiiformis]|uniref:Uncharacterized protein n=1 Tax=Aspergillus coremiiformis TaxID=138285 RepID=A0A5N6YZP2_9EURO|nr:hypothetical protein BDV28DRAFT_138332 [Aspergillus coremiiformis]